LAGNRIDLWGKILAEPELRITPAGTAVLRISVQVSDGPDFVLPAVMTGEEARRLTAILKAGAEVMVKGSLKAVRKHLKSGLIETGYEVMAESIEVGERNQK
jgi:single-stranded DNA-binding protein